MTLTSVVNLAFWIVGVGGIAVALWSLVRIRSVGAIGNRSLVFAGQRHELVVEGAHVRLLVNLDKAIDDREYAQLLVHLTKLSGREAGAPLRGLKQELDLMRSHEGELISALESATPKSPG